MGESSRHWTLSPHLLVSLLLLLLLLSSSSSTTRYGVAAAAAPSPVTTNTATNSNTQPSSPLLSSKALSYDEVSSMRVRDIKRRLARSHGYGADELARMLDKKELIHTLAFEEHKAIVLERQELQQWLMWRTCIVAAVVTILIWTRPIWIQLYEMASVNVVVYTDRKQLEVRRCIETRCVLGGIGVVLMFVLDGLQMWLTVTVLLSWVVSTRAWYFFPVPSLSVQPAKLMGGPVANGPMGNYGINIGSMVVTWTLRLLHGQLEGFVGRCLRQAQKAQRKQQRAAETKEEKAVRKAAKRRRRQEAEAAAVAQAERVAAMQSSHREAFMGRGVSSGGGRLMESLNEGVETVETVGGSVGADKDRDDGDTDEVVEDNPTTAVKVEERRAAAARAAERRFQQQQQHEARGGVSGEDVVDSHTQLDELD